MRASRIKLYSPFIALLLVQGMIMVLAPSIGTHEQAGFGNGANGVDDGGFAAPELNGFDDPDGGPQVTGNDSSDPDATTGNGAGGDGGTAAGAGSSGGDGEATGGDGGGGGGDEAAADGAAAAQGDTSHCTDDGRQHGFFYHAPPCEPASDGTNPGATYQGVTEDEILVIHMYNAPHPLVDAILPTDFDDSDQDEFREAVQDFINEHYELHGRQVRIEAVRSNCPTTPPNPSRCREEVRRVIDMDPFMVAWPGGSLYPAIFDEFARAGIISVGGDNFDASFFNERRPFRYANAMDGNQLREHLAEYYCKKLAGGTADRSGEVIHPQIGNRGEVPRRYGIITPDTPSDVANANALRQLIGECESQPPAIFTYELDIERGLEQATAVVAGLISEGVTTVTCICDPVAPQFLMDEATMQDWYPEHLMLGRFGIDLDPVGRIYPQEQWERAFGPSTFVEPTPIEDNAAHAVWRAAGRDGRCEICIQQPIDLGIYEPIGHLLQAGGADLNPGTVEQGAFEYGARGGWDETGGDPRHNLRELGPNNYTFAQDMREVYWDRDARSTHDDEPGAYVAVDGGRRYLLGEWTSDLDIPMP
jgi:hypothetical protein